MIKDETKTLTEEEFAVLTEDRQAEAPVETTKEETDIKKIPQRRPPKDGPCRRCGPPGQVTVIRVVMSSHPQYVAGTRSPWRYYVTHWQAAPARAAGLAGGPAAPAPGPNRQPRASERHADQACPGPGRRRRTRTGPGEALPGRGGGRRPGRSESGT